MTSFNNISCHPKGKSLGNLLPLQEANVLPTAVPPKAWKGQSHPAPLITRGLSFQEPMAKVSPFPLQAGASSWDPISAAVPG